MRGPVRALVLTGGAARGAFMAGVVESLVRDTGRDFQVLGGVSIGAILTSMLAMAPLTEGRSGLLTEVDHFRHTFTEGLGRPVTETAWPFRGSRRRRLTRELIAEHVDIPRIHASGRQLRVGAVDLTSGAWRIRTEQDLSTHDELLGMVAMPGLDPPVRVGRELWSDGALRRIAPVDEALELHVDELVVITPGLAKLGPTPRFLGLRRALSIALAELVFDKELRLARLVERIHGRPRVQVIAPRKELRGPLDFSPAAMQQAYEHGLELGRELPPAEHTDATLVNAGTRHIAQA